ncbi:hypothetical protein AVEN_8427-1, partial [Araneus ventricosus]
ITRATGFCHLSVTIDGVYTERGSTAGSFSMLSSSVIYVGGLTPTTAAQLLPASRVRTNFIGCVRKVSEGIIYASLFTEPSFVNVFFAAVHVKYIADLSGWYIYKPYPDRTEAGNQTISLATRGSDVVFSSRT